MLEVSRTDLWGYQTFLFSVDSQTLSGLSGVDGIRFKVYTMAVTNQRQTTFYFHPGYSGFTPGPSATDKIIDGIGGKIDDQTDEILNGKTPGVGDTGDQAGELEGEINDYHDQEQQIIDLLDTNTDSILASWNPFKQLNFIALGTAFHGFTSSFNVVINNFGDHFTTVLAFAVCAGFFAVLTGLIIRLGRKGD